ncbi:MAG: NAD-dependent epimerase/dehydratase family protein [Bacteroidaceae bacterium]|nr:NAD-dependent epimerase/dehydratase family protein [Bacteroidaceae bacterium]
MQNILFNDIKHTLAGLSDAERGRFKGSTVLITGCAGFLGYYMMHFFAAEAEELGIKKIIGLDNFMLGYPAWVKKLEENPKVEIQKFDIIKDKIEHIAGAEEADYIIHMASIASPMFYRKYPIETLDANIWGLRSLLDFYAEKSIRGFLFFSSSELYGDPDAAHVPTSEDYNGNVCATGPRACYDESKRFGETMCMLFAQKYNMPIGVARPFNNYGPGMRIGDKRVPADFALAVMQNRDIEILSNGTPTRTFCYIADSVCGYFKILLHGKYDYFNIGIETPEITIAQLAEIYAKAGRDIFGYTGTVKYATSEDKEYLTNNPQRRCPKIDKARTLLGYNPSISVEEGVTRFLQYLKESEEGEYKW